MYYVQSMLDRFYVPFDFNLCIERGIGAHVSRTHFNVYTIDYRLVRVFSAVIARRSKFTVLFCEMGEKVESTEVDATNYDPDLLTALWSKASCAGAGACPSRASYYIGK